MSISFTRRTTLALLGTLPFVRPSLAQASTVEVAMLNKDPDNPRNRNVFSPRVVKIKAGDTVKFVSTDKGHNAVTTKGMMPDGAEAFKTKISKDEEVTFTQPGIYGYHCTPHFALGMVGVIIVEGEGMAANLDAAKEAKQRGKARKVMEEIWAEIEEQNLLA
mgnify:CR=1 FL=1